MDIIKHITDKMPRLEQVVVEHNGNHYLISNNTRVPETLAYMCEPGGGALDNFPVAGNYDRTIAEVMVDIIQGNISPYAAVKQAKFHGF